jgi:hypothetical protein
MRAIRVSSAAARGSRSPSLRKTTTERATASRRSARVSGCEGRSAAASQESARLVSGPNAPTLEPKMMMRRTLSSISVADTSPESTASSRCCSHGPPGPGMTRSRPPRAVETVLLAASQSLTTTPSKPHSPFRTALIRLACSVAGALWTPSSTRLYAAITLQTPASFTALSKGAR